MSNYIDNEPPCDKRLCKHLVHVCQRCIWDQKSKIMFSPIGEPLEKTVRRREKIENNRVKQGIYNNQCFYCILEGEQLTYPYPFDPVPTYVDAIKHSRNAYLIGRSDGYDKKILPEMKCKIAGLEDIYMDGYEAGKIMRELEERTASFCTLLPDFLAKDKIVNSLDIKVSLSI